MLRSCLLTTTPNPVFLIQFFFFFLFSIKITFLRKKNSFLKKLFMLHSFFIFLFFSYNILFQTSHMPIYIYIYRKRDKKREMKRERKKTEIQIHTHTHTHTHTHISIYIYIYIYIFLFFFFISLFCLSFFRSLPSLVDLYIPLIGTHFNATTILKESFVETLI